MIWFSFVHESLFLCFHRTYELHLIITRTSEWHNIFHDLVYLFYLKESQFHPYWTFSAVLVGCTTTIGNFFAAYLFIIAYITFSNFNRHTFRSITQCEPTHGREQAAQTIDPNNVVVFRFTSIRWNVGYCSGMSTNGWSLLHKQRGRIWVLLVPPLPFLFLWHWPRDVRLRTYIRRGFSTGGHSRASRSQTSGASSPDQSTSVSIISTYFYHRDTTAIKPQPASSEDIFSCKPLV